MLVLEWVVIIILQTFQTTLVNEDNLPKHEQIDTKMYLI